MAVNELEARLQRRIKMLEARIDLLSSAVNRLSAANMNKSQVIGTVQKRLMPFDHGELAGLSDDDHAQYLLLAGRAGGQTANGGMASGEDLKLISTAHATKGSVYIGGDGGTTNYSEFESDGTLRFVGAATVYDDLPPLPVVAARLGSSAPTLATFLGNIEQYTFDATNDYVIGATEITHKYKEGTNLLPHIHWATNGSDVGDTGVKWQLEMGVANADGSAPFAYTFTGSTVTTSIDVTIPGGTAALSHIVSDFTDAITGTSLKIGAYVVWRLNRIASATAAPAADPFALAVGFHCEMDTVGSRAMYVK